MITFTKTGNSVKMDLGTDVHYLRPDMVISVKASSGKIHLTESPASTTTFITFLPTEVNGRPSDDLLAVSEFLRDDFFTGVSSSSGTVTLDSGSLTALESITVQNGSGGSAVNIQDGGNIITVDGDVNAVQSGTWVVSQTTYGTSSLTNVAASASSVQLLPLTSGRKGAYFYNDSSTDCYLKLGTTASTSSFTIKLAANSFYELPYPCYTGRIDAIWGSATGNIRITELS